MLVRSEKRSHARNKTCTVGAMRRKSHKVREAGKGYKQREEEDLSSSALVGLELQAITKVACIMFGLLRTGYSY